jgi:hypothetical protein
VNEEKADTLWRPEKYTVADNQTVQQLIWTTNSEL